MHRTLAVFSNHSMLIGGLHPSLFTVGSNGFLFAMLSILYKVTIQFCKAITERGSPFVTNFLKPQVISINPGKLKLKIPFRQEFIGNIGTPCLHGGTISAAIDHCGGICAWSVLKDSTKTVSTVDMRVDFLLPS